MDVLNQAISEHKIIEFHSSDTAANMPIHVAFGVDANFIRPMGVTITSLLVNNPDEYFVFHVFANSINQEDIIRLTELVKQYKTTIHLYHIDRRVFDQLRTSWQYSHATYNRFLLAKVLHGKAEKALYLDADIVCIGKIRELIDIDLEDKIAAVVHDQGSIVKFLIEKLQLPGGKYFNAGVLYIDINKWNDHDISSRAIKLLEENYERFNYLDQDALNVLLDGKVKYVDTKWDFMCNLEKKLKEIPKETVLIHYTCRNKPWHRWCIHPMAADFKKIANQSLWKDVPLDDKPRSYKEMKMLGRALLHEGNLLSSLVWYFRYAQAKMKSKIG